MPPVDETLWILSDHASSSPATSSSAPTAAESGRAPTRGSRAARRRRDPLALPARALLELELERVLVSHGEPALEEVGQRCRGRSSGQGR